jgi:hypothetical protein
MPVTNSLVSWHMFYLLEMGTRGGAFSVTVGSCRCKQEHGTRALSLWLCYTTRRLMIFDFE